jgi:N utilization substance protein A
VRRLFENEIPEIEEGTIAIKAVAREAGYRSKVAVSSIDMKVDCVGACVGVRGSRIKNIVDELGGERIDIVRWNDALQVLIPNALQPAAIEDVIVYSLLGRAIVLVKEDQLSLAIGRRGQNVRLASKLVGWDIEIMTHEELTESIERAERWFLELPPITEEQVEALVEGGFLSYTDLTFLEPAQLAEMIGLTEEQAEDVILRAEERAEEVEEEERVAKQSDEGRQVPAPPVRPTAAERMDALFAPPAETAEEGGEAPPEEPSRQTFQTIFPDAVVEEGPLEEGSVGEQPVEEPSPAEEAEDTLSTASVPAEPPAPEESEKPSEPEARE